MQGQRLPEPRHRKSCQEHQGIGLMRLEQGEGGDKPGRGQGQGWGTGAHVGGQGDFLPGFLRLPKVSGKERPLSALERGYPGVSGGRCEGTEEAGRTGHVGVHSEGRWPSPAETGWGGQDREFQKEEEVTQQEGVTERQGQPPLLLLI